MLSIIIFLSRVHANLIAYSSYSSNTMILSNRVFTFGNPAIYTVYGKAVFISSYPTEASFSGLTGSFVVFFAYKNYTLVNLSLLSQKVGAVGVAFVSQSASWDFESVIDDTNDYKQVNITVIAILRDDASALKGLAGNVWIIYKRDINQTESPILKFYMIGNYTLDKEFVESLKQLNAKIPLTKSNFSVLVNEPDSTDSSLFAFTNCMFYNFKSLCMNSSPSVNGKDKVYNSIMILKLYDYITDLTTFFNTLTSLYSNCEFNYSQACISSQLPSVIKIANSDVETYYNYFNEGYYHAKFLINNANIYWPSYLQSAYCLSFNNAPNACTLCSDSCSYSSVQNSYCDANCNVSSCSYDNMNCITNESCYNFLLNDGQCDSVCPKDPDCSNNTLCTPGCSYSDMKNGLCPLACAGNCFSYCSSLYCSPGCTYSSLSSGICPSDCTASCLEKCNTKCSVHCNEEYTSSGICPSDCTITCCKEEHSISSSSTDYTLAYVLPPIFLFIIISIAVISYCIYRRRQALNTQKGPNSSALQIEASNAPVEPAQRPLNNYGQYKDTNVSSNPKILYIPKAQPINQLNPAPFDQNLRDLGHFNCILDSKPFQIGEAVILAPCRHVFHPNCLKMRLDTYGNERVCPNCRFSLQGIIINLT